MFFKDLAERMRDRAVLERRVCSLGMYRRILQFANSRWPTLPPTLQANYEAAVVEQTSFHKMIQLRHRAVENHLAA